MVGSQGCGCEAGSGRGTLAPRSPGRVREQAMPFARVLLRIAAIVVSLAIIVPVAAVYLFPDRIAAAVAARLERATGVEVSFGGRLHPSVYPVLGLRMDSVAVRNAAWSRQSESATAAGIEVEVSPAALLRGELELTGIRLVDPVIRLDLSALESMGDRGGDRPASGDAPGRGPVVRVKRIAVSNGSILIADAAAGQVLEFGDIHATIDMPSSDAPARIKGSLVRNGTGVQIDMMLDPAAALSGTGPLRVTSAVRAGDIFEASYSGSVDIRNAAAEGPFTFSAQNLREALAFVGVLATEGMPERELSVRGVLTAEPGSPVRITDADIASGDVKLFGRAEFEAGDPVAVRAVFTAEHLDLSQSAVVPQAGGEEDGWSGVRVTLPDLGAVDAVVSLDARSIDFGSMRTGRTRVGMVLRNGALAVRLRETRAFGGSLSGRLDARLLNPPSASVDIEARGVRIEQLPGVAGSLDGVTGFADADIRLNGAGDNLQGIISGLSGDGRLRLTDVRIPDVGEGLLETDVNVASASAGFTVENGVIENDDLAASGSNYTATGRGSIDVGARTADYVLTPVFGSISVPVEVTGPWDDLDYRFDLKDIPGGIERLIEGAGEDVLSSLLRDGLEGLPGLPDGLDPGTLLDLHLEGQPDDGGGIGSGLDALKEGLEGLLKGVTGE